jgi:hypothetical protein
VHPDNPRFLFDRNCLVDVIDTKLVRFFGGKLTIWDEIKIIGRSAFAGVKVDNNMAFGLRSQTNMFEEQCFYQSALKSIEIPSLMQVLPKSCFQGAKVAGLTFRDDCALLRIDHLCFCQSSLKSILIPSSVVSLGKSCISESALAVFKFSPLSRLKQIEELCFAKCSFLSIDIPRSVEGLGKACFQGAHIETITFEKDSQLTQICELCFAQCSLKWICVPKSIVVLGKSTPVTLPSSPTG